MKRINFLVTFAVSVAATILFVDFQAHAAAPPTPQGFITAKEFLDLPGTTIPDLTNSAKFPNNPDIVNYPARFEWPTGPDDATPPPADVRNSYGIQIIGYFYPPVTGQYRFAIAADDNAVLYLSTDSTPANKSAICLEAGWNTVRNWDNQDAGRGRALIAAGTPDERWNNQSKPIALTKGQIYYIEALEKEGGGGDNVAVAYRTDGTWPTVAGGDLPILGSELSTFDKTSGPLSIITQPQSQTIGENQPVTFKVEANGTPPYTYQWQRAPSGSSTFTDIVDATNQTYRITAVLAADNGAKFRCNVTNAAGSLASNAATLTVTNDTTPPTIAKVTGSGKFNRATIVFSEPVTAASAGAMANYQFTGTPSLSISAVTVINPTTVVLNTGTQTEGASYTLVVNNVKDIAVAGNTIAPNSQATLRAFVFSRGFVAWERWQDVGGDTGNITAFEGSLDDPAFRPPDVTGVSAFFGSPRDVADTYGLRASGFFVPQVNGSYVFYLQCDDQGDLFLSTDATPANKKRIASQPGWGPINQWIDPDTTENQSDMYSASEWPAGAAEINLTAGTRYYMEADFREGGGGDGVEVYYKLAAAPLPVNGVPPNTTGVTIGTFADPTGSSVTINQQPQSLTVSEGRKANFSVTATGSSAIVSQWQKAASGSSTFTDIVGANSTSFTTAILVLADSGTKYRVVLSVLGGATATSSEATLTVNVDTNPPVVLGSTAFPNSTKVGLTFDKALDAASAGNAANYKVNGVAVTSAVVRTNVANELTNEKNLVQLTVATALTTDFTLTLSGVKDFKGNTMGPTTVAGKILNLTSTDIGSPAGQPGGPDPLFPSTVTTWGSGAFDVLCNGNDYWNNADGFNFVWEPKTNSFDVKVRVVSVSPIDNWSAGAIEVREGPVTINGGGWELARHYFCKVDYGGPDASLHAGAPGANAYEFNCRLAPGDPTVRETGNVAPGGSVGNWGVGTGPGNPGAPPYPNAWIRIARVKVAPNDFLRGYSSTDGITWDLRRQIDLNDADHAGFLNLQGNPAGPWPDVCYVGLGSTSHTGVGNQPQDNDGTHGAFWYSPIGQPFGCYVIYRDYGDVATTPLAPTLAFQVAANGTITLSYTGTLVSSDTVNGTYQPVTGATSPFTVNPKTTGKAATFYQARQ